MQNERDGIYLTDNNGAGDARGAGNGGKKDNQGKIRGHWLFLTILIIVPFITFSIAAGFTFLYRVYETLPINDPDQLQNVEQSLVSKVFDKDGNLIHEFSVERRFWVPLDKIPVDLQNAVLAIEDRKFYKHWGVDIHRNIGALVANVTHGRLAQGASTITQQLARNLYLTADKSFIRKVREILTAMYLERIYTKREILELYLNQAYLGAGVYGVQAAAERYYSKNVWELTLDESAVIAGTIQRPESHRPDRAANVDHITARRNTVLRSMVIMKAINASTAQAAMAMPIAANPKVPSPPRAPYFVEMVRRYISEKYGDDILYNGGLTIHTTLDLYAQDSTEASAARQVVALQRRLNRMFLESTNADHRQGVSRNAFMASFDSLYALRADEYSTLPDTDRLRHAQIAVVAKDVRTGAIRTLIGGRSFQESRFNRVTQARRQPGSLFKSYVYAAALDHGFTPATVVLDQPITLITPDGEWRPTNYDNTFAGPMSIRDALARSNNLVAIQVFNRVGGQTVVDFSHSLGIRSPLQPVPSLAIGACEMTPMEALSTHALFANRGVYVEPYFVEKIVDRNGRVMEAATPRERMVMSPQNAFLMSSMLNSVVCCGTGASIPAQFRHPAGGKTGTTNDYTDAWFVGFTSQIAAGVWVGIDERRSMGKGVTGTVGAIPVWIRAMQALHKNLPIQDFHRPDGIRSVAVCHQTSGLARTACPRTKTEFFMVGGVVPDTCAVHGVSRLRGAADTDLFGPTRRGSGTNSGGSGSEEIQPRKRNMMF